MDIDQATPLLGGLSPAQFMRRHWQKRPLLVRQALPPGPPPLSRTALFDLAARDDVESRCVARQGGRWLLRHGPLQRRRLPALKQPGWTVLVQGVDAHCPAARALLDRFRFVSDARLDDLMVSWASDGGGVGPHLDSYDVFLVQVQGRRRWRIGRCPDARWVEGLPLKILQRFEPEQEWLLEPGDLLYLPPRWGHDGVADGECMTCSVGFRSPTRDGLAADLLGRLGEAVAERAEDLRRPSRPYRDPGQGATTTPGALPGSLRAFAREALTRALADPRPLSRVLGESLTEPKPQVWFASGDALRPGQGVRLADGSRMLYDEDHLFLNGEAYRASGRDARWMRRLADERRLTAAQVAALSPQARDLVSDWSCAGWVEGVDDDAGSH